MKLNLNLLATRAKFAREALLDLPADATQEARAEAMKRHSDATHAYAQGVAEMYRAGELRNGEVFTPACDDTIRRLAVMPKMLAIVERLARVGAPMPDRIAKELIDAARAVMVEIGS